jgi:hypothetical protein
MAECKIFWSSRPILIFIVFFRHFNVRDISQHEVPLMKIKINSIITSLRNPKSQIEIRIKQYFYEAIALVLIKRHSVGEITVMGVEFKRLCYSRLKWLIQTIDVVLISCLHTSDKIFIPYRPAYPQPSAREYLSCAPHANSSVSKFGHA